MNVTVDLRVLELLSSRLCHELISPVGAINNGIELMGEDDPDFVKDATKLIASSARTAGNRLNFYRFAYGSGRAGTGREVTLGLSSGSGSPATWWCSRPKPCRAAAPSRPRRVRESLASASKRRATRSISCPKSAPP
jgi:hypothetical protein